MKDPTRNFTTWTKEDNTRLKSNFRMKHFTVPCMILPSENLRSFLRKPTHLNKYQFLARSSGHYEKSLFRLLRFLK